MTKIQDNPTFRVSTTENPSNDHTMETRAIIKSMLQKDNGLQSSIRETRMNSDSTQCVEVCAIDRACDVLSQVINTKNTEIQVHENLVQNVIQWARDKNILAAENAHKQMLKVVEEVGETVAALLKNKSAELKDGIGDSLVTLIILSAQLGLDPMKDCLQSAYDTIKNRTGQTKNGIFIKN